MQQLLDERVFSLPHALGVRGLDDFGFTMFEGMEDVDLFAFALDEVASLFKFRCRVGYALNQLGNLTIEGTKRHNGLFSEVLDALSLCCWHAM